ALVSGLVGLFILNGFQPTIHTVGGVLVSSIASYHYAVLAFFILLGVLCSESGIADGLLDFSRAFLGHLSGGLAIATTLACALFGAISGSTTAASAVFAKLALPGMDEAGYDRKLSGGVVAASGTLAIMIPPSNLMLIYAIMAEQSVGKLLISGILPGCLLTIFYIATIWLQCRIDPKAGPPGPSSTWSQRFRTLLLVLPVFIIFLMMMIGIYTGLFSSTEASAVGVGAVFLLLIVMRKLKWKNVIAAVKQTVHLTVAIMVIVMCVRLVSTAFAYSGFTLWLTRIMSELPSAGITVMVVIVLVYLVLGCVVGSLGMLFLTIPVFLPLIVSLGYDPIWFGVITVCACEIAFITPPVSVNVYVTAKVIGWRTEDVMNGVWLFVVRDLIVLVILILFPQISLWLPSMMK
ncbi:MAG: TRAP transporter large permease, partial [Desulfobacterales bacterium]|nr:TRAP transporter large permease [Desulfobacterales bacterium]